MRKILRVGGYVRVSTDEQKKFGYSIQAQCDEIQNWCKATDNQLIKLYIDEGYSASTMNRPQLKEMLNDLKDLDIIVFTRLDRLSRNVFEANTMLKLLDQHNVAMKAICEDDIDTSTANGLFIFNLKVNLAQHELDKGSERIKAVFDFKIKAGQPVTGSLPYGYKIDNSAGTKRIIKDEETEHIVNEIFSHFKAHHSVRATTIHINEKYGLNRHYSTYRKILSRHFYTGIYRDNPNYAPPYITQEQFELNQELIKKNLRVKKNKNVYLFSALIKCPACGGSFVGKYYTNNNRRYYAYRCGNANMIACNFRHSISEKKIEKFLLNNLETLITEQIRITDIKDKQKSNPNKRIAEIKREMENLTYIFRKGRISPSQYDLEYTELEQELAKLKPSPNKTNYDHLKAILSNDWKTIYNNLTKTNKQAFWQNILREIKLDTDLKTHVIFK